MSLQNKFARPEEQEAEEKLSKLFDLINKHNKQLEKTSFT